MAREVGPSPDFTRVRDLPIQSDRVDDLTERWRTEGGTMRLREVQSRALREIERAGGLLGPIPVGGGKTLISLLAPAVLVSRRPLLLLPAALVDKTRREMLELMRHWRIPRCIRIESYQALSRLSGARDLEIYRPDCVVADEAHRLKHLDTGVTRRVARYLREHPDTKFVCLSGTICKHSLQDFGHLSAWALGEGSPLPLDRTILKEWADALDERVSFLSRMGPGVLGPDVEAARKWFAARMLSAPGVVALTADGPEASLSIRSVQCDVGPATDANFDTLRTKWEAPDGWALSEAATVWALARQLSLGLHYEMRPRPPPEWMAARRDWAGYVREQISNTTHAREPLDTELQVVRAVERGRPDAGLLARWRAIKPTFTPNPVPVWHDDHALDFCAAWAREAPGIVWTEHTFFGRELARRAGLEYYGADGVNALAQPIEAEDGSRSVVASVQANGTGRNLQKFSRSLVTALQPGADVFEQLVGRTHRQGQGADEVSVDVLVLCAEHADAWDKLTAEAAMHRDALGQPQKVHLADVSWEVERGREMRWRGSCK